MTQNDSFTPHDLIENEHVPLISNEEFIRMEIEQIKQYKQSVNLSDQEAAVEWISKHSRSLRDEWHPFVVPRKEFVDKAKEEIAKHRWIESEKSGKDLGIQAEMDWIQQHSRSFKDYWCADAKEGITK